MVGFRLLDVDREKIAYDRHLRRLMCAKCTYLVKEPISLSCGHVVCCSCLESIRKEGNSSVVVCPADDQELPFQQAYPDERAEKQVLSLAIYCTFKCNSGKQCEWNGPIRQLEMHWKNDHQEEGAAAKVQVSGLSGVLQDSSNMEIDLPVPDGEQHGQQNMDHKVVEHLKQQLATLSGAYATEKCHREQLENLVSTLLGQLQVLEHKQCLGHNDVENLKRQVASLGNSVASLTRDHKQLQGQVEVVQREQLAVFANDLSMENRNRERLDGKMQSLEQEHARGVEALNLQGGLLQDSIGRLQISHANVEARVRRLEEERLQGFNVQGV